MPPGAFSRFRRLGKTRNQLKAMLAFDHPMDDETRMPITPASAQLVERLRKAREALQDLRAEFAGAAN